MWRDGNGVIWRNGRKVITQFTAGYAAAMMRAKADLQLLNAELQAELDMLRAELEETRAAFRQLQAVTLARHRADKELAALYRERSIQLAQAAGRDWTRPLH